MPADLLDRGISTPAWTSFAIAVWRMTRGVTTFGSNPAAMIARQNGTSMGYRYPVRVADGRGDGNIHPSGSARISLFRRRVSASALVISCSRWPAFATGRVQSRRPLRARPRRFQGRFRGRQVVSQGGRAEVHVLFDVPIMGNLYRPGRRMYGTTLDPERVPM